MPEAVQGGIEQNGVKTFTTPPGLRLAGIGSQHLGMYAQTLQILIDALAAQGIHIQCQDLR